MQCASCPYLQTGVLVGHCCRRCPSGKGHGPLCERRLMHCQSGCGFAVTRHGATHCCKRCARGEGFHGPHCARELLSATEDEAESRFVGPRCLPVSLPPSSIAEAATDEPDPILEARLQANAVRMREQQEEIQQLLHMVQKLEEERATGGGGAGGGVGGGVGGGGGGGGGGGLYGGVCQPTTTTVSAVVPEGSPAGSEITVEWGVRSYQVVVPEGVGSGETISVELPTVDE